MHLHGIRSDLEKSERHGTLNQAATERSAYHTICKRTREIYKKHMKACAAAAGGASTSVSNGVASASAVAGQSRSFEPHYSFDFVQQVHLPSDPVQPGSMYFLTTRKCALFGLCYEAISRQVNEATHVDYYMHILQPSAPRYC